MTGLYVDCALFHVLTYACFVITDHAHLIRLFMPRLGTLGRSSVHTFLYHCTYVLTVDLLLLFIHVFTVLCVWQMLL